MRIEGIPRVIGWVLWVYPAAFRHEYGEDLCAVLRSRAGELPSAAGTRFRFWLREGCALFGHAVRERLAMLRSRRAERTGAHPSRERDSFVVELLRETRFALRRLLVNPVFGIAAVFTLALAIGANTAIFTLIRRVVLYPFPYAEADRLVMLEHASPDIPRAGGVGITMPVYFEYRERLNSLADAALYQRGSAAVGTGEQAERVEYLRVTPNLAGVLGVTPALGRWFVASDAVVNRAAEVVVLSHGYWQRVYGSDPSVLGRTMRINGAPVEVVGVMPRTFTFPAPQTQFWLPYAVPPGGRGNRSFSFESIGRLAPGATMASLEQEMRGTLAVLAALPQFEFEVLQRLRVSAQPVSVQEKVLGSVGRALWILFGAVVVVLLIACANVANLFVVRLEAKQRELAIRRALGAGKRAIALYFLSESLLIGLLAGGMGYLIALAGVRLLGIIGPTLPRFDQVQMDGTVALFTLGISLSCGLFLGLLPLLQRSRNMASALHESSRGNTAGRRQLRGRNVLAAVQIALALVLLIGAGLMLRSYRELRQRHPGFATEQRLMFRLALTEREYPSFAAAINLHQQFLAQISALPGVQNVSTTTCFPLEHCWGASITTAAGAYRSTEEPPMVWLRRLAPGYFSTMGTRMVRGRDFEPLDFQQQTGAAIINQALADFYFLGQDPVGQRIYPSGSPPAAPADWLTVVGVVENMAGLELTETESVPQFYVPFTSEARNTPDAHGMVYVVHTTGEPLAPLPAIRRVLAALNPNLPVSSAETVQAYVARAGVQMEFTMAMLLIAAGVAFVLGIVGVYAVISYAVTQRQDEMGVRLALGASPEQVVTMIVREGGLVVLAGVAMGVAGALATTRVLTTLLFGVSAVDPATYAAVAGALAACALLACYLPARRASRMDPGLALRVQ